MHVRTLIAALALSGGSMAFGQPLPTDPRLVTGELDNGLKYIIMPNKLPEGRLELYVHMHTGSLNETDRQRGIAHYLEHMAFNGSDHFPPGSLVPAFQSKGLQFGRDQNAFTNMQETSFQLSFPDNSKDLTDKGLTFFSDVVGRLSLLPKEIDAERQIIQEERRRGLSGQQRTSFYVLEHLIPGSIYGQRITIGTEATINGVNQADFKDYYGKWYGASNATVIVVGDIKPEEFAATIKDKFGDLPKKPKPKPQELGIRAQDKPYAIVASDPEITSARVEITRVEPARGEPTTVPQMRVQLIEAMAERCFNTRMGDKVSRGGTSFLNLNASMGEDSNVLRTTGLSISCEPSKWQQALADGATELQRVRKFGFFPHELERAKTGMISAAERAVTAEETVQSKALIGRLNRDVGSGSVTMSPQQDLEVLHQLLPSITVDEVSAYFAKEMELKNAAFVVVLPSNADIPTEPKLLELGLTALKADPAAEAEAKHAEKLIDQLPKPGTVAEFSMHEPTGVWNGWLSNGVRVHHKFMDRDKDEVSISINLAGGELLETADNRGITTAANLPLGVHATSKLTSADIRELMVGKKVRVGGGGGFGGRGGRGGGGGVGDGLHLSVNGSNADLETGMQLAYLLLTDAKIEDASFAQWKTRTVQGIEGSMKNPSAFAGRLAAATIFPTSDARLQPLTVEQVQKVTQSDAQAWLNKLLRTSPIEVTVIGDIQRDKAIELVTKYLGSLPPRDRISSNSFMPLRTVERPKGARTAEKTMHTDTPQASVLCGFYGADEKDLADVRALNMACRVLSTRMIKEVREDAQLVYSIGASSSPATTYPGFGMVQAGATTEPEKVPALIAKLHEMFVTFAKDGCTAEELDMAKLQFAKTYEEQVKEPGYWRGRLDQIEFRGMSLDDINNTPDAYQALTADQVKAAFAKYWAPERSITISIRPDAAPKDEKKTEDKAEK